MKKLFAMLLSVCIAALGVNVCIADITTTERENYIETDDKTVSDTAINIKTVTENITLDEFDVETDSLEAYATFAQRYTEPVSSEASWWCYSAPSNNFPLSPINNGNCTWYAYGRTLEVYGQGFGAASFGNAGDWFNNARARGLSTGSTPKAGSIICWGGGGYGHVAFVEEVSGSTVTWTESNYQFNYEKDYPRFRRHSSTHPETYCQSVGYQLLGYIYFDGEPTPPANPYSWSSQVTNITETNAHLSATLNTSTATRFVWKGCNIFDANGNLYFQMGVNVNYTGYSLDMSYDLAAEGVPLKPNTTYKYQFYANAGGADRFDEMKTFVTSSSDPTPPNINTIQVVSLTDSEVKIKTTFSDNVGVTRSSYPTWTDNNGQDDLIWHDATIVDNSSEITIPFSEHNGEAGLYITHVYVYDAVGNEAVYEIKYDVSDKKVVCPVEGGNIYFDPNTGILTSSDVALSGTVSIPEYVFGVKDAITGIGSMAFSSYVNAINIPETIASIDSRAFVSCDALSNINVDENNKYYKDTDGILYDKSGDTILCYPPAKSADSYTINDSVKAIGDNAFYRCLNLTQVTIPDSVSNIGNAAFSLCINLKDVEMPEHLDSLGRDAFSNCGIEKMSIPEGVKSLEFETFGSCPSLNYVKIPESVTTLKDSCFVYTTGLTSILIPKEVTDISKWAFSYSGIKTVYVYKNSVADNKALYPSGTEIVYLYEDITSTESTSVSSTEITTETTTEIVYGDADNDGELTANDSAYVIQKVLNGLSIMPIEDKTNDWMRYINVDGDDQLTSSDAAFILQKVLVDSFKFSI